MHDIPSTFIIVVSCFLLAATVYGVRSEERPSEGVRLYLDYELPNYSMMHTGQFYEPTCDGSNRAILCQSANNGSDIGTWYDPHGNIVPIVDASSNYSAIISPIISMRCRGQIGLGRTVDELDETNEGLYKCVIPNQDSVNETLVVGIYSNETFSLNDGPKVESTMTFKQLSSRLVIPPLFSLSFNVSNGPPTVIQCTINQTSLNISSLSVHILNALNSITQVILTLNTRQTGIYQCTVSNARVTQGNITDDITAINGTSSLNITVAEAPYNLTGTRLNTGRSIALLSWSSLNGGEMIKYEIFIEYDFNAGNPQFSTANTINTTFIVEGLIIDETFTYSVIAYRDKGNNILLPSDPSQIPITFDVASLSNTSLTAVNSTAVIVMWTLNNSSPIIPTSYILQQTCKLICDSGLFPHYSAYHNVTSPYLITGIAPYSECKFNVIGLFGTFTHFFPAGTDLRQRTLTAVPTLSVNDVTTSSVEARSMIVSWNEVPCTGRNGPIDGYYLTYTNTLYSNTVNITTNRTQYTLTGLIPYTNYTVTVRPYNNGSQLGPVSYAIHQATNQSEPSQVINLTLYSTPPSPHTIIISWLPPTQPNGIITQYEIYYHETNNNSNIIILNNTTHTQYSIEGLVPNTDYTIRVRAYTSVGPGLWSELLTSTNKIPLVLGILVTRGSNSHSLFISWQLINDSTVYVYTVYYYKTDLETVEIRNRSFSNTHNSGVIDNLEMNSTYIVSMSVTLNINETNYEGRQSESVQYFLSTESSRSSVLLAPSLSGSSSSIVTAQTVIPLGGNNDTSTILIIGGTTGIFIIVIIINVICLILGSYVVLRKKSRSIEITSTDKVDSVGTSILFNSMLKTSAVDNPMYHENSGNSTIKMTQLSSSRITTPIINYVPENNIPLKNTVSVVSYKHSTVSGNHKTPVVIFNPQNYEEPLIMKQPENYEEPLTIMMRSPRDYEEPVVVNSEFEDYETMINNPQDYEQPIIVNSQPEDYETVINPLSYEKPRNSQPEDYEIMISLQDCKESAKLNEFQSEDYETLVNPQDYEEPVILRNYETMVNPQDYKEPVNNITNSHHLLEADYQEPVALINPPDDDHYEEPMVMCDESTATINKIL